MNKHRFSKLYISLFVGVFLFVGVGRGTDSLLERLRISNASIANLKNSYNQQHRAFCSYMKTSTKKNMTLILNKKNELNQANPDDQNIELLERIKNNMDNFLLTLGLINLNMRDSLIDVHKNLSVYIKTFNKNNSEFLEKLCSPNIVNIDYAMWNVNKIKMDEMIQGLNLIEKSYELEQLSLSNITTEIKTKNRVLELEKLLTTSLTKIVESNLEVRKQQLIVIESIRGVASIFADQGINFRNMMVTLKNLPSSLTKALSDVFAKDFAKVYGKLMKDLHKELLKKGKITFALDNEQYQGILKKLDLLAEAHIKAAEILEEGKTKRIETIANAAKKITKRITGPFTNISRDPIREGPKAAFAIACLVASAFGTRTFVKFIKQRLELPNIIDETNITRKFFDLIIPTYHRSPGEKRSLKEVILDENTKRKIINEFEFTFKALIEGRKLSNILLIGPPGTGKTMASLALIRTLIDRFNLRGGNNESVHYVTIKGSSFSRFKKDSNAIKALKNFFDWANSRNKPLIVFIDEIEGIFGEGRDGRSGDLIREFLAGFDKPSSKNIMFIGTSNDYKTSKKKIDEAVLSRFSSKIYFGLPKQREIKAILNLYLDKDVRKQGIRIAEGVFVKLDILTEKLVGFSPRAIEDLVYYMYKIVNLKRRKILTYNIALKAIQNKVEDTEIMAKEGQLALLGERSVIQVR